MDARKNNQTIKVLRTLGDETRFQIVSLLLENDLCVGALAHILNISKPAVSQHLKILREADLVRGEKRGYWTHYEVKKETLREAARILQKLSEFRSDTTCNDTYICLRERGSEADTETKILQMCNNRCEQPDKLKTRPEK